jgi:GNAT superfamily N-acetyltransferase
MGYLYKDRIVEAYKILIENSDNIDILVRANNDTGYYEIIANEGGKDIGHITFTFNYPKEGLLNIEWIEVDEDHRRKGVSGKMIDRLKTIAKDLNMTISGHSTSPESKKMLTKYGIDDRNTEK